MDTETTREYDRLWGIYQQRGLRVLLETAADELVKLRRHIAEHVCDLPETVKEALNSGKGIYAP